MSSQPATMYLPSIAAHSQLVPSVQVTATNKDFDDLYDATEEEVELPTPYDFAAPLPSNGYVPITHVSAFVASLKAPTKKSLKALRAVTGNAADACLQWQDEYLKLESQLRQVDETFTRKSDPHHLMGFNANGVDLYEEWKERSTPKGGFHEDPGYTVPRAPKKREPKAKPAAAKPTTDNLAIDMNEAPVEGGRGQRTRKPPKRFGDDVVGPKGPEKTTRAPSEPKAAEEPTKKRKRQVEKPTGATAPPPAKRQTRAMSVVKKEPTPSPAPSPPPPPPPPPTPPPVAAPAAEKKRKRAEEAPAPTLPPARRGRATRSASAAAPAPPAKPSTQAPGQANKRVKLTQQFLSVLPPALPAAAPPPPAPKKRGRPPKSSVTLEPKIAKKRGRPRKIRSPQPNATATATTANDRGQSVNPVRSSAMAGVWARRIAAGTNGRNGGAPKPKTVKKRGQLAMKMIEEEEEEEEKKAKVEMETEAEDEEMADGGSGGSSGDDDDDDDEEGQAGQMAVEV